MVVFCFAAALFSQSFQVQVIVFAVNEDGSGGSGASNHSHQRTLVCGDEDWCDPIVIMHLGYLAYSRFRVIVAFVGLESPSNHVEDIEFEVSKESYHIRLVREFLFCCKNIDISNTDHAKVFVLCFCFLLFI